MKSYFSLLTLVSFLVAGIMVPAYAQFFDLQDVSACNPDLNPVTFETLYFDIPGDEVATFEWSSLDVTLQGQPLNVVGIPIPYTTQTANADYEMTITLLPSGDFRVTLEVSNYPSWFDNLEHVVSSYNANGDLVDQFSAFLVVYTPPTMTFTTPATNPAAVCEGEDIFINTSFSGFPDEFRWYFNGSQLPGEIGWTLTIPGATAANSGTYQIFSWSAECGLAPGPSVLISVVPGVALTEDDMVPKSTPVGTTVTFQATADNVDALSSFTWEVGGMAFTIANVPGTVMVGGNTLQVNSIVNTPNSLTNTTSVVSITNISPAGAPTYSADVKLTVSNNTACSASAGSVMTSTSSVFPVEWLSFDVRTAQDEQVQLQWATASETNNEVFFIERSVDAKIFLAIGEVNGKGTTTTTQAYRYTDDKLPAAQVLYYRLKQVDYDGSFSYSALRQVSTTSKGDITFGPIRQYGNQLELSVFTPFSGPATVSLYDLRGVRLQEAALGAVTGEVERTLTLPAVAGVYVLRYQQDGVGVSRKIVLTR